MAIDRYTLNEWKLRVFCTHCGHHYDDVYRNKVDSNTGFDGVCPTCGKLEPFAARVARMETTTVVEKIEGRWRGGTRPVRKDIWVLHEDALPLYDLTLRPGNKAPTPNITVHPKMMMKIVADDIPKEAIEAVLPQDRRRGFSGHIR